MPTIRFFVKATGADAPSGKLYFIFEDGTVWRDNEACFESQERSVSLGDFIVSCPDIGWEVIDV
jgi:hypothetical protein